MKFILELNDIGKITYILKMFFITYFSYCIALKIINKKVINNKKRIISYFIIAFISIICGIIKYEINFLSCLITLIMSLSILLSKVVSSYFGYATLLIIISLSLNYIFFIAATTVSLIPTIFFNIQNMYISLAIIILTYIAMLMLFFKKKRFKNGIIFLQRNVNNQYFDILLLNISAFIMFCIITLNNYMRDFTLNIAFAFIFFAIIMFITIQKSLQLYYKQKLLIKELDEIKSELEKKTKEVEELETENLSFSKKSHTLAHKQKSLEYKLQEIINNSEISKEEVGELSNRIKEIAKDLYKEKTDIELDKTGIVQIDDMLKYMQSDCKKNKIEFELQIKGNIHYMTNNLISKEELETLLADHIKNAIIAINHTENINRSILLRLGKIDDNYGLYIYDSGIEFKPETLENLGKKPSTTHADEGGTGMGFMNTFDTIKKSKASLIIEEFNEPSKDNYTKVIMIKFDNKNEFKVKTYRENLIIK